MAEPTDKWIIVLAGLTSGIGAASVNIAARFADDPGDILGFFGGALGACLAVLGALAVERQKEVAAKRAARTFLAESLVALGAQSLTSKRNLDGPTWATIIAVIQAIGAARRAHEQAPPKDALLNAKLGPLLYWLDEWERRLVRLSDLLDVDPVAAKAAAADILTKISDLLASVLTNPQPWPAHTRAAIRGFLDDATRSSEATPHFQNG